MCNISLFIVSLSSVSVIFSSLTSMSYFPCVYWIFFTDLRVWSFLITCISFPGLQLMNVNVGQISSCLIFSLRSASSWICICCVMYNSASVRQLSLIKRRNVSFVVAKEYEMSYFGNASLSDTITYTIVEQHKRK